MASELTALLDTLYTKRNPNFLNVTTIQPLVIIRILAGNRKNAKAMAIASKYLFYIQPKNMLYYLFSIIPKVSKAPFVPYVKVEKIMESELEEKLRNYLGYSKKEFSVNREQILTFIESTPCIYKQLGVKQ